MKTTAFLVLIRESRKLIRTATPEQKIKLLSMIREGYKKIKESRIRHNVILAEDDADYISEK